jgi:hypothetical protein
MIMQNVSAVVRNANEIEVTSPAIGTKVFPVTELMTIMEVVTTAIEERFSSPKEAAKNPPVEPKMENVMNGTTSAAPAAPAPAAASGLTYRTIIFQVLREAKGPISIKEACEAAKPLIDQMGATGKTPMGSFKAKFYVAAKKGKIVRVGDKFTLPGGDAAPAAAAAAPAPAAPAPEAASAPAPEAPKAPEAPAAS